uniref:Uncharacterized protein n=1 Tax=Elaeophora elaphi TaxID=1147741 RepID=A0A0R3RLE9_9BILA
MVEVLWSYSVLLQHFQQQRPQQQLLSSTSARTDTTTDSSHRSYKQQRNERQLISSSGLIRQIDNAPHSYCQFAREISQPKLLRPIHDNQEYGLNEHHIPVFRSNRPYQQQQVLQSAAPRRLTRIPMNSTIEERLPSRSSTITEWQRSSSTGDYLSTRS